MKSLRSRFTLGLSALLAVIGLTGAGYAYHAASVSTRISASIATTQSSTLDLGTASYSPTITYAQSLTNGTGNSQFQIVYADSGTLAASDSVLVDLAGAIPDAFGTTIACATGKAIMVTAKSTNVNDVLVGGATVKQTQFLGDTTDVVPVGPGGVFLLARPATGWTVTGGSRDIMRLKNSGGTTGVGYTLQVLCK